MSTTYIANIVSILTLALPVFGVHVADPGSLTETLTEVAGVAAAIYVFYGRYKAGGISIFGIRAD
jgi:hypothetical protein